VFLVNVGYTFELDPSVAADGAIVLCSAMPMHQLERRNLSKYPYMARHLFDPQLYLAGLEAARAPDHCAKLATYPWFGAGKLCDYDSAEQRQSEWKVEAAKRIRKVWRGEAAVDSKKIAVGARECIDFQIRKKTWGTILPSPLTIDFSSDYSIEAEWLDASLAHLKSLGGIRKPVFATVAISDNALRFHTEPDANPILGLILDQVSAREVDGVYLVIEQSTEDGDTRQCGSARTLRSLLHLVHRFSHESELQVGVNFIGAFALACEAAGASWWASNWYKSLHRVRLADKVAGGQVYPLYWSGPSALDLNMESDFDALAKAGLHRIGDHTPAASGLLRAAGRGVSANTVPAWRYAKSNRKAAIDHFLQSAIQMEALHSAQPAGTARLDHVERWLHDAESTAAWASSVLGVNAKTKLSHVSEWFEAFRDYRLTHSV
jgi:hypothetical protein